MKIWLGKYEMVLRTQFWQLPGGAAGLDTFAQQRYETKVLGHLILVFNC